MYYSKIEAAASVDHRALAAPEVRPGAMTTVLGLTMLLVGLPILALRLFVWAVARDVRRLVGLGGIVGQAFADTARGR